MKLIIARDYPSLHLLGDNKAGRLTLDAALLDACGKVPQALIDRLIDSMPRRVETLRKAGGWYTKY